MCELFFILFTVKISFFFDAKKDTQELNVGNYLVPLSAASNPPYNPCTYYFDYHQTYCSGCSSLNQKKGSWGGSVGSVYDCEPMRCRFESHSRNWVIKGLGIFSNVCATGHIKDRQKQIWKI